MYKRNVFERIHDLSESISNDDYFSTGNLLFEYYFEYQYGYNLTLYNKMHHDMVYNQII